MMNIYAYIWDKLIAAKIPMQVADVAAKLIDDNEESQSPSLDSLLDSFIASYQSYPDEALDMLEKSLITGNSTIHIFNLKKR